MGVFSEEFNNSDNINELLGSEVSSGELVNEDIQNGNVLSFDGSGDYVNIENDSSLNFGTGDFSISAWVKTKDKDINGGIAGKGSAGTGGKRYKLRIVSGGGYVLPTFDIDDDTTRTYIQAPKQLENGVWTHIVGTADRDGDMKLYINGQEVSSDPNVPQNSIDDINEDFLIGRNVSTNNEYFNGSISDVRIYSEALTPSQIKALYTHNAEPPTTNLQGHWKLNEGTGTTAIDSSSNGNNGTIVGATWAEGSIYPPQSRTTSINLLNAERTLTNFKYTTSKKPAGTNGRVQFSKDYDAQRENVLSFGGDAEQNTIDLDASASYKTNTEGTLEAYIKIEGGESGSIFAFGRSANTNYFMMFGINSSDQPFIMQRSTYPNQYNLASDVSVPVGVWTKVKYMGNGSTWKIFINDEEVTTTPSIGGSGVDQTDWFNSIQSQFTEHGIGYLSRGASSTTYFLGSIADIKYYSSGNSPTENDLVGHWKLDEGAGSTVTDLSVNANNGTITGATWETDKELAQRMANWTNKEGDDVGDFGAYEFDGVDDEITVPSFLSGETEITIALWVKFNNSSNLLSVQQDNSVFHYSLQLLGGGFIVYNGNGGNFDYIQIDNDSDKDFSEWTHYCVTWNSLHDMKIFINGYEVESTYSSLGSPPTQILDAPFRIGCTLEGDGRFFEGQMSDVRVYSRNLKDYEIWNLYAYSIEPSTANLQGHWKLNGNALDSSGNGNHGTVDGAINITNWNDLPHVGHSLIESSDTQVSSFDGVNDWVEIDNLNVLDLHSNGTITAWIKPIDAGSNRYFLTYADNNGIYNYIAFGIRTSSGLLQLASRGTTASDDYVIASIASMSFNDWNHISITSDGVNYKMYINGIDSGITVLSNDGGSLSDGGWFSDVSAGAERLTIGQFGRDTDTNFFNGQISNVAIYNDVRTPSEIKQDFLNGYIDTTDPNLVSYWPLAGDYQDKVGTNHGTNNGSTIIKDLKRPQPLEPTQQTIDVSALGITDSINYKVLLEDKGISSYALDQINLEYLGGFKPKIIFYY
jgi:hypothetical protein